MQEKHNSKLFPDNIQFSQPHRNQIREKISAAKNATEINQWWFFTTIRQS